MKEIRFLAIAQAELDDAVEYYNCETPGLGDAFLLEALKAIERIKGIQRHGTHSVKTPGDVNYVVSHTESSIRY